MSEYLNDFLLVISLMGAPIVLGKLLFYGLTINKHEKRDGEERPIASAPPKNGRPGDTGAAS